MTLPTFVISLNSSGEISSMYFNVISSKEACHDQFLLDTCLCNKSVNHTVV